MKKTEMVTMILEDMYSKASTTSKVEIDKKYKGWLNRQSKQELETIMRNRKIAG